MPTDTSAPVILMWGARRVCHSGDPWSPAKGQEHRNWRHPNAEYIGTSYKESYSSYRCLVCGYVWREECTQ